MSDDDVAAAYARRDMQLAFLKARGMPPAPKVKDAKTALVVRAVMQAVGPEIQRLREQNSALERRLAALEARGK